MAGSTIGLSGVHIELDGNSGEGVLTLATDGRIELRLTITRDPGTDWTGGRGRADEALIRSMLKSPETRCLICGPPALITDAAKTLRSAGVPDRLIVSEQPVISDQ